MGFFSTKIRALFFLCFIAMSANSCAPVAIRARQAKNNSTITAVLGNVSSADQGRSHTCAVLKDSTAWCWGFNSLGQLGNGTSGNYSTTPVQVSSLTGVTKISLGGLHTCALKSDGTVWCWGYGGDGQLGNGAVANSSTPVQVSGLADVTDFSAGGNTTCAIKNDGTVWCWGEGSNGQIGDGNNNDRNSPLQVSGLTSVIEVASVYGSHCALKNDSTVWCWGAGTAGQLGNSASLDSNTPVQTTGIANAVSLDGSRYGAHFCTLLSDYTIKCWGQNDSMQLADTTSTNRNAPIVPTGLPASYSAREISLGASHSCLVLQNSQVYCWGIYSSGQQTPGSVQPANVAHNPPTLVSLSIEIKFIYAGNQTTCALDQSDYLYCWGLNNLGQTGTGTSINQFSPITSAPSKSDIVSSSVGKSHVCIVNGSGTVSCWGDNTYGQLGNGTNTFSSTPVFVSGISNATQVSSGFAHSCARLSTGDVSCWGYNGYGELGDGTTTHSNVPVTVALGTTATHVAAGGRHTCAITTAQSVRCWGDHTYGQGGDGTATGGTKLAPVNTGLANITSLSSGAYHTCAITSATNFFYCWGLGTSGQLGNGLSTTSSSPVTDGATTYSKIGVGANHSCGIALVGGTIRCWGSNYYGQIGDGTYTNKSSPTGIIGVLSATDIAGTDSSTCAVQSGPTLIRCWGNNREGQAGTGSTSTYDYTGPQLVIPTTAYNSVSQAGTGAGICVYSTGGGSLSCWGNNAWALTGRDERPVITTPTKTSGL